MDNGYDIADYKDIDPSLGTMADFEHLLARAVSRFGNDSEKYRVISAKMLATCLHMMQGTPYVYEGEELGMTNADFAEISEYRDLEALDIYYASGG